MDPSEVPSVKREREARDPLEPKAYDFIPWIRHCQDVLSDEDTALMSLYAWHWDHYLNDYRRDQQDLIGEGGTLYSQESQTGAQVWCPMELLPQCSDVYVEGRNRVLSDAFASDDIDRVRELDANLIRIAHLLGGLPCDVELWRGLKSAPWYSQTTTDYQSCSFTRRVAENFSDPNDGALLHLYVAKGTPVLPVFLSGMDSEDEVTIVPNGLPVRWTLPPGVTVSSSGEELEFAKGSPRELVVTIGNLSTPHPPTLAMSFSTVMRVLGTSSMWRWAADIYVGLYGVDTSTPIQCAVSRRASGPGCEDKVREVHADTLLQPPSLRQRAAQLPIAFTLFRRGSDMPKGQASLEGGCKASLSPWRLIRSKGHKRVTPSDVSVFTLRRGSRVVSAFYAGLHAPHLSQKMVFWPNDCPWSEGTVVTMKWRDFMYPYTFGPFISRGVPRGTVTVHFYTAFSIVDYIDSGIAPSPELTALQTAMQQSNFPKLSQSIGFPIFQSISDSNYEIFPMRNAPEFESLPYLQAPPNINAILKTVRQMLVSMPNPFVQKMLTFASWAFWMPMDEMGQALGLPGWSQPQTAVAWMNMMEHLAVKLWNVRKAQKIRIVQFEDDEKIVLPPLDVKWEQARLEAFVKMAVTYKVKGSVAIPMGPDLWWLQFHESAPTVSRIEDSTTWNAWARLPDRKERLRAITPSTSVDSLISGAILDSLIWGDHALAQWQKNGKTLVGMAKQSFVDCLPPDALRAYKKLKEFHAGTFYTSDEDVVQLLRRIAIAEREKYFVYPPSSFVDGNIVPLVQVLRDMDEDGYPMVMSEYLHAAGQDKLLQWWRKHHGGYLDYLKPEVRAVFTQDPDRYVVTSSTSAVRIQHMMDNWDY